MANIRLTWTDPSQRTDGSPLPASEIASIDIFMAVPGAPSFTPINSVAAGDQALLVEGLVGGTYQFEVRVMDSAGRSSQAATTSVDVPIAAPNPVSSLSGVVE